MDATIIAMRQDMRRWKEIGAAIGVHPETARLHGKEILPPKPPKIKKPPKPRSLAQWTDEAIAMMRDHIAIHNSLDARISAKVQELTGKSAISVYYKAEQIRDQLADPYYVSKSDKNKTRSRKCLHCGQIKEIPVKMFICDTCKEPGGRLDTMAQDVDHGFAGTIR